MRRFESSSVRGWEELELPDHTRLFVRLSRMTTTVIITFITFKGALTLTPSVANTIVIKSLLLGTTQPLTVTVVEQNRADARAGVAVVKPLSADSSSLPGPEQTQHDQQNQQTQHDQQNQQNQLSRERQVLVARRFFIFSSTPEICSEPKTLKPDVF
ncbi:hypothetical protein RRG08_012298 [Elysia crispata]|uniref:Uncharacterized protein n=1 Tax=Elysia crispata TaxID=231223 RepID=A0AAE1ECQ8_9GAST|nr:hypothetical protein RRG08_012298 [Elysia crispata]